jgi:hypothetical protein
MATRSLHAVILVNTRSASFLDYPRLLLPYLEHFGIPCVEADAARGETLDLRGGALIVAGHDDVCAGVPALADGIADAIASGTGLVSFDRTLPRRLAGLLPGFVSEPRAEESTRELRIGTADHFITALHAGGETLALGAAVHLASTGRFAAGQTLVSGGCAPLLQTGAHGGGRVALWNDTQWMLPTVRGPVHGMDDLVWRSIVWAARKPFVLQGMPPMLSVRVDDVWGSGRTSGAGDPLGWARALAARGLPPWLGLFLDNIGEPALATLRELAAAGGATFFPHAFSGDPSKVPVQAPEEEWIYFDHRNKKPWDDGAMRRNIERVEAWHRGTGIPIGRMAIPHYYEMGSNALPALLRWGCDLVGLEVQPDRPYFDDPDGLDWIRGGPYRNAVTGVRNDALPSFYAHPLRLGRAPELDNRFFNVISEIRDITGYEWSPDNDVAATVDRGGRGVERQFQSMVPGTLFTHESDFLQYIEPGNWSRIIDGVLARLAPWKPRLVTLDHAGAYVKARSGIRVTAARLDGDDVALEIAGSSGMPTSVYRFDEDGGGAVTSRLIEIPACSGRMIVRVPSGAEAARPVPFP